MNNISKVILSKTKRSFVLLKVPIPKLEIKVLIYGGSKSEIPEPAPDIILY
jgi:hypothetical protein